MTLSLVALFLPFTSEYRPLGERMAQRYAENFALSAADVRAREAQAATEQRQRDAAARQQSAAEVRAREQARSAEEERQQAARDLDRLPPAFLSILRTRRPPVIAMVANANKAVEQMAKGAQQPSFYSNVGIKPEEASSRLACTDPAGTMDMLNRDGRRDRNILACGVYMALHRADNPDPGPQVMAALIQRLANEQAAGYFPLQTLVSYVWLRQLTAATVAGQPSGPFPDLNDGEAFNPALFRDVLPPSFARRLIDTATTEEKLELSTHAYPDLRRMAELGARIVHACQVMQRSPCLTPN